MLDANDLLNAIKKAANEANDAGQPADFCFGEVTNTAPLQILVEQKMTLGAAQLVLTRNVTDFKTTITGGNIKDYYYTSEYVGEEVQVTSEPVDPLHKHAIGTVTITIHNGLQIGDEVILLKRKGGQKYLVIDRVVTA